MLVSLPFQITIRKNGTVPEPLFAAGTALFLPGKKQLRPQPKPPLSRETYDCFVKTATYYRAIVWRLQSVIVTIFILSFSYL